MKLIFLDIDGVLNDHHHYGNHYCRMKNECVMELARILDTVTDAKIIVTSAWRYLLHQGTFTSSGLEYLFCMFGMPYPTSYESVVGFTATDEDTCVRLGLAEKGAALDYQWLKENGELVRREQVYSVLIEDIGCTGFVVLDDLDLQIAEQVRTDGTVGLTRELADQAIAILNARSETKQSVAAQRTKSVKNPL